MLYMSGELGNRHMMTETDLFVHILASTLRVKTKIMRHDWNFSKIFLWQVNPTRQVSTRCCTSWILIAYLRKSSAKHLKSTLRAGDAMWILKSEPVIDRARRIILLLLRTTKWASPSFWSVLRSPHGNKVSEILSACYLIFRCWANNWIQGQ